MKNCPRCEVDNTEADLTEKINDNTETEYESEVDREMWVPF